MATIADKKKESQKRAIDAWNAREKALQARNPDYTPRIRTYSEPKPLAPKREYTGRPIFNPRGPTGVQPVRNAKGYLPKEAWLKSDANAPAPKPAAPEPTTPKPAPAPKPATAPKTATAPKSSKGAPKQTSNIALSGNKTGKAVAPKAKPVVSPKTSPEFKGAPKQSSSMALSGNKTGKAVAPKVTKGAPKQASYNPVSGNMTGKSVAKSPGLNSGITMWKPAPAPKPKTKGKGK